MSGPRRRRAASLPTSRPMSRPTSRPASRPTSGPSSRPTSGPTSRPTSRPTTLPAGSAGSRRKIRQALGTKSPASSPRDDPKRYQKIADALLLPAQGRCGRKAGNLPWTSEAKDRIVREFRAGALRAVLKVPRRILDTPASRLTWTQVKAAIWRADGRLRRRWPMIKTSRLPADLRQVMRILQPSQSASAQQKTELKGIYQALIANQLDDWSSIEKYILRPRSPQYKSLLREISQDSTALPWKRFAKKDQAKVRGKTYGWLYRQMLQLASGFNAPGQYGGRVIYLHRGLRGKALGHVALHELIHYYTSRQFQVWLRNLRQPRLVMEGVTEVLTRATLPMAQRGMAAYVKERAYLRKKVLPYLSLQDIAKAYFGGEIWRLEIRSSDARTGLRGDTNTLEDLDLKQPSTRAGEITVSRRGSGIGQVVRPGRHYRLLGFGANRHQLKSAHGSFLSKRIIPRLLRQPRLRLIAVGHSTRREGKAEAKGLSRRRARAVYAAARRQLLAALKKRYPKLSAAQRRRRVTRQLPRSGRPAGVRASRLNVAGNGFRHRLLNRRVEIYLRFTSGRRRRRR
ncbi:MAG: PT domain-containing protein [Acidobacteriota bacterium]